MVIHLDGWGLEGWIFIGVSMEKEWSGQQCLGVAGLGGLTAAPWRRRGDQMLCNWRAHACGAPQVIRKLQRGLCCHESILHLCRHTPVFPEARGIFLMHLFTSYVEQRSIPLRPPRPSLPD